MGQSKALLKPRLRVRIAPGALEEGYMWVVGFAHTPHMHFCEWYWAYKISMVNRTSEIMYHWSDSEVGRL